MTEEEKDELSELKVKCLKMNGDPRKNAETEDLERLKSLCEQEAAEAPLTEDEQVLLGKLEVQANSGRQVMPNDMHKLGALRRRAEANK